MCAQPSSRTFMRSTEPNGHVMIDRHLVDHCRDIARTCRNKEQVNTETDETVAGEQVIDL